MEIDVLKNNYEYSRLLIASLVFLLSLISIWVNKLINDKRSKKEKLTEKIELISLTALELQDSIDDIFHVKRTETPNDYLEVRNKSIQFLLKLENLIALYFNKDLGSFEFKNLHTLIHQSYSNALEVHGILQLEKQPAVLFCEYEKKHQDLSNKFHKTLKDLQVSIIKVSNLYTYNNH
jgi:hypothetical protein